ncbi:MAG: hypothetical protein AB1782_17425 [Cyanobacteriota bacterium]
MYDNIKYTSINGQEYVINGDAPDFFEDFSHKVLFSIENTSKKMSFSYYVGVAHQLWEFCWKVTPENEELIAKVKEIYLEKAKRLIDSGKEEYLDVTLTAANTPSNIDKALEKLKEED